LPIEHAGKNLANAGMAAHISCIQRLTLMKETLWIREWVGPALGIALGLSFGYILGGNGTTAGPALFALVIVPIVIWMSPKRPMLGWQLPIVSFAVSSVLTHLEYPGQKFDLASDSLMVVMEWAMLLVFSSPWGLLLLLRARQSRTGGEVTRDDGKRYALVVGLIVVGGFLLLFSWAMVFAPNSSAWSPVGGLLVGTIGMAAWKYGDGVASGLGKAREVARHFMQLGLVVCPLMALGGGHSGGQIGGWSRMVFGGLLSVESLAVLIWLSLKRRIERESI
jgi:hypothetical protein